MKSTVLDNESRKGPTQEHPFAPKSSFFSAVTPMAASGVLGGMMVGSLLGGVGVAAGAAIGGICGYRAGSRFIGSRRDESHN